jgi:hypothetical protein
MRRFTVLKGFKKWTVAVCHKHLWRFKSSSCLMLLRDDDLTCQMPWTNLTQIYSALFGVFLHNNLTMIRTINIVSWKKGNHIFMWASYYYYENTFVCLVSAKWAIYIYPIVLMKRPLFFFIYGCSCINTVLMKMFEIFLFIHNVLGCSHFLNLFTILTLSQNNWITKFEV